MEYSKETADVLVFVVFPAAMYFAALAMFWLAWRHADHADAVLYEITRREVEARLDLPRDARGRFLPRRHLGPDSLATGEFLSVD